MSDSRLPRMFRAHLTVAEREAFGLLCKADGLIPRLEFEKLLYDECRRRGLWAEALRLSQRYKKEEPDEPKRVVHRG